ncbi:flagellar motor switch protein FliN [Pantoea sp.]|uniref:flagellar motor switch protein FliN n=1 Tax=Pantoea sp. TaxID=69393 RepID=UPI00289642E4|nr:flagellar motor switch protein FliN [Pantoea sp.]
MTNISSSSDADQQSLENLWGDAMSEQQTAENLPAGNNLVSSLSEDMNLILDIPVKMTVELGRTKMTVKELLRLSQGAVVSLDGLAGEPLDILINGYLIAQGEVVVVSDKFGIRITDIITPSERMHRLSR